MSTVKVCSTVIEMEPTETGRRFYLTYPSRSPFHEHAKNLKGYKFEERVGGGPVKVSVSNHPRNWTRLNVLAGKPPKEWGRYSQVLPTDGDYLVEPTRECLKPWQREMLDFMATRRSCVVAGDLGLGKTLAAFEAMEVASRGITQGDQGQPKWLYTAPANVLDGIRREIRKWRLFDGDPERIQLVSHAKLAEFVESIKSPEQIPCGFVFDESSRIRNTGTDRTDAAVALAELVRNPQNPQSPGGGCVFLLSAKPAPKDPLNWWSQVEIACPGWLEEASIKQLRANLGIFKANEEGYPELVGWKAAEVEELGRRVHGVVGVWRKEDVLKRWPDAFKLPEVREIVLKTEPTDQLKRAARLIVDTAESGIEALSKMRQLSDGFQYTTDEATGERGTIRIESGKDALVRKVLRHATDRRSTRVVFSAPYRESIKRVTGLCEAEGWSTAQLFGGKKSWPKWLGSFDDVLREFDQGTVECGDRRLALIMNPRSGGMGLTLHAAKVFAWFSLDFDRESFEQFKGRGPRQGADPGVHMDFFHIQNLPVDRIVLKALNESADLQGITLEAVREQMEAE